MNKLLVLALLVLVGGLAVRWVTSPSAPDVSVLGDEVTLATDDLDVRFAKGPTFDETFMIFGGGSLDHGNAVARVTLAGLSLHDARPIYRRHPDFHRCASPGAAMAKDKVAQLDIVPADGATLGMLEASLQEFERNLGQGGDRVCVQLHGARLELTSARVREAGEDVSEVFGRSSFYLVDAVDRVACREALGA